MSEMENKIVDRWGGDVIEETKYIFLTPQIARKAYNQLCKELPGNRYVHMGDEILKTEVR